MEKQGLSLTNNTKRIVATCLISLFLVGYRFGDADHNSLIPFLYRLADPSLYPNSSFFYITESHISYFWYPFIPLAFSINLLASSMFIVYLFVLFFLFKAFHHLITIFADDVDFSYFGLLVFVVPAFSFSIMGTYENYLINRVAAVPLLVFSISYFLRNRYILAGLLVGLAFNIHLLSASFVIILFFPSIVDQLYRNKLAWADFLKSLAIFGAAIAPITIWGIQESGLDFSINWEWYRIIKNGALGHMFNMGLLNPPVIILSIIGVSNTFVFLLVITRYPRFLDKELTRKLLLFFSSIYLVLFIAYVTAEFFPVVLAIKFQLTRIGKFIPILSFPFFIGFLNSEFNRNIIRKERLIQGLLTLALFGWLVPSFLVYRLTNKIVRIAITFLAVLLLFFVSIWAVQSGEWKPGIHIYPEKTPWHEIQVWISENTEKDSVFIVPVHKWGHYEADFALLSQRTPLVTLGELMTLAYHPQYVQEWKRRFEDLLPGTTEEFSGNFLANKNIASDNYSNISTDDFIRVSENYGAEYIITEKPHILNLEIVYENSGYILYRGYH